MYKEYRWQPKEDYKAFAKQKELCRAYGVKIPIFEIEIQKKEEQKTERFLSMVYPEGLVPKTKKGKDPLF
jgi:hypothetical protein